MPPPHEPSDAQYDLDIERESARDWRERQAELELERADEWYDWQRDRQLEHGDNE
jgi:hypothetical protein